MAKTQKQQCLTAEEFRISDEHRDICATVVTVAAGVRQPGDSLNTSLQISKHDEEFRCSLGRQVSRCYCRTSPGLNTGNVKSDTETKRVKPLKLD